MKNDSPFRDTLPGCEPTLASDLALLSYIGKATFEWVKLTSIVLSMICYRDANPH